MTTTSPPWLKQLKLLAIAGVCVLACGMIVAQVGMRNVSMDRRWFDVNDRIWSNLLIATFYLLTVGLGGAVFLALTYVSGAGWHAAFRRVPETMAKTIPWSGLAILLVLGLGIGRYGWHHHGDGDAGTFWFKEMWLTPSFWFTRAVAYVVIWSLLARWLVNRRQRPADIERTGSNDVGVAAAFLAVYAVTFSLASVDWMMALEPMWFSTMWGVYNFAGMIQAALATVVILCLLSRSPGRALAGLFSDEHLHDLGKLLLGFSCFWMYIWFSQYMLIWYSNIPEETSYFISRMHGPWGPLVVVSIVMNWVVPFFVLLPKPAKRNAGIMMRVAVVMLAGRWVDLYVMVMPSISRKTADGSELVFPSPVVGLWEVAALACLIGAGGWLLFRTLARAVPVPRNDPYLAESLHYHA